MHKLWGKIVFGISTASLVGLYCLSFMPSALAKGNGNGNSQNNTTTSSNNGGGNGNGNNNNQSNNTSTTTSSTTTSSNSGSTQSPSSTSTASSDFSSIVFNLDCVISGTVGNNSYSGSNCTNAGVSFGTLTIKQNPFDSTKVDVVIDLAGNNVHKILDVSLNYNDSKFQNNAFEVSSSSPYDVKSFNVAENSIKAGPYSGLDLKISPKATGPSNDGFTATISLDAFDLNPEDFNFQDQLNKIFAAVHIGNYGNDPGVSGGNSIWVGASSYYKAPPPPVKVPEPGVTGALGLFAVTTLGLMKKNKQFRHQN
ncbi:hypothetical protein [Fischerella thermalis]|uniref:hypothetical protein n=1 Tax=Fischerella thermalis TaxID=372787 RepID=UPI000C7FC300|nr:hypothetical protein [Fischerella thermalis]PLZ48589.1 hypothetical protein CBP13_19760 [Fischerella thermalis WC441]PLZ04992.1 hypothetical protein CBP19_22910 [Fischerella thermalis WC1110]PLZ08261.1 hypothetical protein CBP18_14900 [Fischerella thermalis WC119]PLZ16900.1 hypothetical protein CBP29_21725 [Fischerella thermalis WC341]PLZ38341.1 hypothetical protein CBP26_15525 [Fischerella thermalis WC538]